MSDDQFDPESVIKAAYGVLQRFLKNLPAGYDLKVDREESIVIDALKQHSDHLATHGIKQTSIDALKLTCWLGGSLLKTLEKDNSHQFEIVVDSMIKTLRELMVMETQWNVVIPPSCIKLLKSCLLEEWKDNYAHGIWMNGLYMSFHCSIKSWREGQAYKKAVM